LKRKSAKAAQLKDSHEPLRVLIIEDSKDDAELLVHKLRAGGFNPSFRRVDTAEAMRAALDIEPWDIVLSDFSLPQFSGPEALQILRASGLDLPFIVVSGSIGEAAAVAMMRAGADDYIFKDNLSRFVDTVKRELHEANLRRELKLSEAKLAANEKQFRSVIENSSDVISLIDANGLIKYSSPSVTTILGYTDHERIGQSIFENIHPEDLPRMKNVLSRLLKQPGSMIIDRLRYRHSNGDWLWMEGSAKNLLVDPDVQSIVVNYRNITESMQTEKALVESEKRHRELIETAAEIIFTTDIHGRYTYANPAALHAGGYTLDELTRLNAFDLILSGYRHAVLKFYSRQFRSGKSAGDIEFPFRTKSGEVKWFSQNASLIYEGDRKTGWRLIARDITDRKHLEEERTRFSRAMESSLNEIYLFNPESLRFEYVNSGAQTNLGYTLEQLRAMTPLDLKPEFTEASFRKMLGPMLRHEQPKHEFETVHRRADGSLYPVAVHLQLVEQPEHTVFLAVILDITERKQHEERLALLNFALNHSHEASYLMDENACFLDVNDEACRALGYTREELLHMKVFDIDPYYPVENWQTHWKEIMDKGSRTIETSHRRKDGHIFPIEVYANYFEHNGRGYNLALVRDITERKEAQDRILRLNRVYKMLSAINTLIVHVHDQQELLNGACRIAVEDGECCMAWIGLIPAGEKVVVPQAWAGHEDGYLQHVHVSMDEDGVGKNSVCNQAIRIKKPVIRDNIDSVDKAAVPWKDEALSRGYRSKVGLPLIAAGKVIGVMSLYALVKDFFDEEEMKLLTELASDISYALQNLAQEEKLNYLASYDPLTGLANRILFYEHMNSVLERAEKSGKKVALLACDLRQFRNINSVYGRGTGDLVLQETARRLRGLTEDPVNIARISADYFTLILHDVGEATGIGHLFEHTLFPALNQPLVINEQEIHHEIQLNYTGGIAVYPADGKDAETLYRNAEAALKKAKLENEPYLFYQREMTARISETLYMEGKLRTALKEEQFVLHYQPKIDSQTRKMVGLEALIRWNDPETGLVPPMKFIPILEESGLILEVGLWALDRAASDYRQWQAQFKTAPRIAVNVSAVQLRQKDFVAQVEQAIRHSGEAVPLDIELTESLVMTDIEQNISKLKAIQLAGLGIAIDDFGTGYSSLSYIAKLPIDALKIDRSFISNMTAQADSMSIVSTIITLAHALNFKVIAEGVESEEQAKFLTLLKCDEMQGYLFSKPLPVAEITELLRSGKPL